MGGSWLMFPASLGAGVCGGMLSGLFGIGGGIVLIPLLGLALGLNQHQAQGVALAAMLLPNGLPAVLYLRRRGITIHWALVAMLTAGFLPAVWVGARIANLVPESPLRLGFASVLAILAVRMLVQRQRAADTAASAAPLPLARVWLPGLVIGLTGGLASGLLGIGGGIIMIPLMTGWLGLPQHEAQTTSLVFMLAPIGLPGVWVYAHSGAGLPWLALGGVAVGFVTGAYAGARVASRIHAPRLRQGFAALMLAMAAMLFAKGI